jgi:hypothetical protein
MQSEEYPIAVNMTATTTLMPAGVDLSKSRWKNMKLGISQAGLAAVGLGNARQAELPLQ